MIAAKAFDPVLGVDIHIIQPPGPVPPVPVPHPFVGLLIDPMDFAPIIGATVMVNGLPRATAGTGGKCVPPHIPIGGVFVKPPANECEVFMGSSTVLADGDPLSSLGMPALSCHDVGMVAPFRASKKRKTKSLVLPTSVVLSVPAGAPVLVGGPPTISMMAMGMKAAMAGLGKAFGKLRKLQKGSRRMKALSAKARNASNALMDKLGVSKASRLRNKVDNAICAVTGHPVDIVTGKVMTEALDFMLRGPIPLRFHRIWYSTSTYEGPLGHGWHHSYDMALAADADAVVVRLADGRAVAFPALAPGASEWHPGERFELRRTDDAYALIEAGLSYHFEAHPTLEHHVLRRIETRDGHSVRLTHDERGRLNRIVNSAGRWLALDYDDAGRVVRLRTQHHTVADRTVACATYTYDAAGNLVAATDAVGASTRYAYRGALLASETDRTGFTWQFEYDAADEEARCIRTWGDGGYFDRSLRHDPDRRSTVVTNSLGEQAHYGWTDMGVVTTVADPAGRITCFEWDEAGNIVREIDPSGNSTLYAYDDASFLLSVTDPLGRTTRLAYDDNHDIVAIEQPGGRTRSFEYDALGRVTRVVNPLGGQATIEYDALGRIDAIRWPDGTEERRKYDERHEMVEKRERSGALLSIARNAWGLVTSVRCSGREATTFQYDRKGRPIRVRYPHGAVRTYTYDGEDRITEINGPGRARRRFAYTVAGRIAGLEDAAGGTLLREWDTEGRLRGVRNARGEWFRFEYDGAGRVVRSLGFDGVTREFVYDAALGPVQVREIGTAGPGHPLGSILETRIERDTVGRVRRKVLPDGAVHTFGYDDADRLIEASSPEARLGFVRDALGHPIEEWLDGRVTRYRYDAAGRLTERQSPLGNRVSVEYPSHAVTRLTLTDAAGRTAHAEFRRANGLPAERVFPGGVREQFGYDDAGRLATRVLRTPAGLHRRIYAYGEDGLVARVEDDRIGTRTILTDEAARIRRVTAADGRDQEFAYDANGNVLAAGERRWSFGPGDRITRSEGRPYAYDAFGNLIRRPAVIDRGPTGDQQFRYNACHELTEVRAADGAVTRFAYDAIGRRIRKAVDGRTTEFLWAGEQLLAEITEEHSREFLIDRFRPVAIFDAAGPAFAHTGRRGAPDTVTGMDGGVLWAGSCDEYGNMDAATGSLDQPFRLPGQFHDAETGLSYSLFRYYDPRDRRFINQDPIRLSGGAHLYSYARNPVHEIDPWGLYEEIQMDTPYGEDPLSKEALQHRVDEGVSPGKNVAVIEYVEEEGGPSKYSVAHSDGPHAERLAWDDLPEHVQNDPSKVKAVYTEYEPCDYHKCGQHLEVRKKYDGPVYYHHKYNPKGPVRTAGQKQHKKDIKDAMAGLASCGKK